MEKAPLVRAIRYT